MTSQTTQVFLPPDTLAGMPRNDLDIVAQRSAAKEFHGRRISELNQNDGLSGGVSPTDHKRVLQVLVVEAFRQNSLKPKNEQNQEFKKKDRDGILCEIKDEYAQYDNYPKKVEKAKSFLSKAPADMKALKVSLQQAEGKLAIAGDECAKSASRLAFANQVKKSKPLSEDEKKTFDEISSKADNKKKTYQVHREGVRRLIKNIWELEEKVKRAQETQANPPIDPYHSLRTIIQELHLFQKMAS